MAKTAEIYLRFYALKFRPNNAKKARKYGLFVVDIYFIVQVWQGQKGSNPRHAVLETAALPAELYPCIVVGHRGLEPRTDRL